jgi:prepilin-type N-terminal cleavage/methylation domain-containing protein
MRPALLQRGLTLLELLIVLMLIGLLSALAVPRIDAQLQDARQRALQRQLRQVLEDLPIKAFESGQPLLVSAEDLTKAMGPDWPADSRIALSAPLQYGASGIASGGAVSIVPAGREPVTWYVEPFTGKLLTSKPEAKRAD